MDSAHNQNYTFRPFVESEATAFDALLKYAFADDSDESDERPSSVLRPEWSQCAFDGETMVATSGAFPFDVLLNGKKVAMHGVTMVGTDPAHRRQGLVRRLITDLLHRAYKEGCAGSILLASMGAIYQRFGYGLASNNMQYRFDPNKVDLQFDATISGRTRRLPIEEAAPIVRQVFDEYVKDKNMMALRDDEDWDRLLGAKKKTKPHFAAHFSATGEPEAYCVYTTKASNRDDFEPYQDLKIIDFYYTTIAGYRAIWSYLCSHDLVGKVFWALVPEDDPAPLILLEPRNLYRNLWDGLWFRIVDIEKLLAGRGYECDGQLVIEVANDDLCPWNNRRLLLSVTDGHVKVGTTGSDPDMLCTVQGAASLLSGFASGSSLHRSGRLEITDPGRSAEIDRLFASRFRPHRSFDF